MLFGKLHFPRIFIMFLRYISHPLVPAHWNVIRRNRNWNRLYAPYSKTVSCWTGPGFLTFITCWMQKTMLNGCESKNCTACINIGQLWEVVTLSHWWEFRSSNSLPNVVSMTSMKNDGQKWARSTRQLGGADPHSTKLTLAASDQISHFQFVF